MVSVVGDCFIVESLLFSMMVTLTNEIAEYCQGTVFLLTMS